MASDRSRIAYAKTVLMRQFSGAGLTSGTLTAGTTYFIHRLQSGDDFRNVGAPANRSSAVFTATGTTPTTWSAGSRLVPIDLERLKAYALEVFSAATDTVTITSGNFEGGSGQGEITFPKVELGIAIEELIAYFDPDHIPTATIRQGRSLGPTIRFGGGYCGAAC